MKKTERLDATRVHILYYFKGWITQWFETLEKAQQEVRRLKRKPEYRTLVFRYMKIIGYD
jgi:hypothetical protein